MVVPWEPPSSPQRRHLAQPAPVHFSESSKVRRTPVPRAPHAQSQCAAAPRCQAVPRESTVRQTI